MFSVNVAKAPHQNYAKFFECTLQQYSEIVICEHNEKTAMTWQIHNETLLLEFSECSAMNASCTIQLTLSQNSIYLKFKWRTKGRALQNYPLFLLTNKEKSFFAATAALANDDDDNHLPWWKWITILTLEQSGCKVFKLKFKIIKFNYTAWHCSFASQSILHNNISLYQNRFSSAVIRSTSVSCPFLYFPYIHWRWQIDLNVLEVVCQWKAHHSISLKIEILPSAIAPQVSWLIKKSSAFAVC